jgi:predicted Zn-dependent protease
MSSNRRAVPLLGITIAILFILTCAVNPVTGKKELMLVSEQEEIEMGKETDAEVIQTYGVVTDAAVNDYVNGIGQAMCKLTHRPNLPYQFKVLDTPVINAFAVPGGYVYVTRGILAYLNDEAELAGVIGHELGHVNARHSAKQMSQQQLAQIGLGLGMALSEKLRQYSSLVEMGMGLLFLKFSRDDERQADDLGVEYGSKSDYDMNRMAAFFETLERLSPGEGKGLPDWFSTHPNPVNRVAAVRNKTAQWRQKLAFADYAVRRNDYLRSVNGILFGEDPRQGYVEGNVFYHPALRFKFTVPAGWQVENTPAQIQIAPEDGSAAILMTVAESASASQAADAFVEKTGALVQSREPLTVNSFQAQRLVSRVPSDEDTLQVTSTFIVKSGKTYAMHGMSGETDFSRYAAVFSQAVKSFRQLDDPAKINVRPKMLSVKTVVRDASLRSILKQYGFADDKLEDLAVMNGMQLDETVAAGTLIKIPGK